MLNTPATPSQRASEQVVVDSMKKRRLHVKTQTNYASKLKILEIWVREHENPEIREHYDCTAASLKLPLPADVLLLYFGSLRNTSGDASPRLAHSTVGGFRSAIVAEYKKRRIAEAFPTEEIAEFVGGYKHTSSDVGGKAALPFTGFRGVVELSLKRGLDLAQYLIMPLFAVLCWNLMARSISIALLSYTHISWGGDALKIKLPRHKGDQEGTRAYDKHVYANVRDPLICPMLHLGVHIVCTYKATDMNHAVFTGAKTESKFSKWLTETLRTMGERTVPILGFVASMLGTHSFRKGCATYCQSFNGGPSTMAVFNRVGWSLGNVHQRNILPTAAADQLLGRVACGLPWNETQFSVLPPHFASTAEIRDEEWENMVPGYQNYPNCFKACIPYLVASVVYHLDWLRENLPPGHPFLNSRCNTCGVADRLRSDVIIAYQYCADSRMVATGIPESLVISEKVVQLQTTVAELSNIILNVDSNAVSRQETLLNTLPGVVVQEIMSKFTVEGAVPLTFDDLRRSMQANTEALQNFIEDRIRLVHVQNSNTEGSLTAAIATNGATLQLSSNYPHYWNHSHHAVPQNYEFPSTSVKNLWDLWFYGNASINIAPLRFVNAKLDLNKAWKVRHTRAKYVMVKLLGQCSYSAAEIAMKSRGEADTVFEAALNALMNASPCIIGKECDEMFVARLFQLSYSTVYKKINEKG